VELPALHWICPPLPGLRAVPRPPAPCYRRAVSSTPAVFIVADSGSTAPSLVIGGLTVLERRLREAERRGVPRALVACAGELPRRPLAIPVERVAEGSAPPPGVDVVRADELCGVRLDGPAAARQAEWKLLRGLPKSFQGPADALVNQHISLRITRLLCRTPITPNQVTAAALLVGLVAAVLLAGASRASVAAAGALIFLQNLLDSCDGELARLRYQFSAFGQWLDNIADDVVDAALMVGLGAAAGGVWLWLGLAAGAARVFTQLALYVQVRRLGGQFNRFRWWFEEDVGSIDDVYDPRSPRTWLRSFARRDVYLLIWAVLCVAGAPVVAAAYADVVALAYLVVTALHLVIVARRPRAAAR
jgi:phosphatidylglycerophosphate synthase